MDITLIPVTKENWRKAVFLTTDPERKFPLEEQWLANNAFSLLQTVYDPDWDCRLIQDGELAVGFVFYGYSREDGYYMLCRFMIDERYQGQGYGKRTLPLVVDLIRKQYGCQDVYLSVHDDNVRAVKLYMDFGFERTERMDAEDRVYVLRGSGNA